MQLLARSTNVIMYHLFFPPDKSMQLIHLNDMQRFLSRCRRRRQLIGASFHPIHYRHMMNLKMTGDFFGNSSHPHSIQRLIVAFPCYIDGLAEHSGDRRACTSIFGFRHQCGLPLLVVLYLGSGDIFSYCQFISYPHIHHSLSSEVVNIGDTAHTASVQLACDVSNREYLFTPGKPVYATLSSVRINNRKQLQSLAQVRMSQKRFMWQKLFSPSQERHKSYPRRYRACLLNLPQASRYRGFALYPDTVTRS